MPSARALVFEAPRQLVPRNLAIPEIGDDDGLLRIEACGLLLLVQAGETQHDDVIDSLRRFGREVVARS